MILILLYLISLIKSTVFMVKLTGKEIIFEIGLIKSIPVDLILLIKI